VRRLAALACLATACCAVGTAAASPPPAVDAPAWIVENGAGEVLAGSQGAAPRAIASITKLMTVLVVLDHHRLSDLVTVDARAAAVGQESIALRSGEQLTVRDLIRGALIQSANDAAVALALGTSPDLTAFANLMNAKARELGLVHTHFVRPDGLDAPGAYSTAADVTTLARDAMKVPFIRDTVAEATASIAGGRVLHTWNDLLGTLPGVIGVKTGHTDDAGWSQVAADRRGRILIYATILGSPSRQQRNADLQQLLTWGLSQFMVVDAVTTGRPYAEVELPFGRGRLPLVAASRLRAVVSPGRALTQRVVAVRVAKLPVYEGEVLGRVEIWMEGKLLGRRGLVASRSVAAPGVAGRVRWYATRTVKDITGLFT
jgi:serine-type D-Ala-D-Ala carboxypeptidase (penicillin-binding protein 5/6)